MFTRSKPGNQDKKKTVFNVANNTGVRTRSIYLTALTTSYGYSLYIGATNFVHERGLPSFRCVHQNQDTDYYIIPNCSEVSDANVRANLSLNFFTGCMQFATES